MGTRAMINFKIGKHYIAFHNQYDGQWGSLGSELSQWQVEQSDIKALQALVKYCLSITDTKGNYDIDKLETKWGELASGMFWDWYFIGIGFAPDIEHMYNYLWQGGKWFAYDYDFKTWRPLSRVVKRDSLSQYENICSCFDYEGRFMEWDLNDYFQERIDIRDFYYIQNIEAEKRNLKQPFMYKLFKEISQASANARQ